MTVHIRTIPYVLCIGDESKVDRYAIEFIDVDARSDIDDVLSREVFYYLDHDTKTMEQAVFESGDVTILKIHEGPNGERGPFGKDWLVAKISPAVRAVAEDKQLILPLQLAS